ncbi:MAG: ATP synthase F1 subunit gamma [Massilibacteroides sp.]|nr:ATP synthase F1 subunit gamma [Massilibacteroides sp.]MDD3063653.1 ATP synthase F1 subunit gamma [Massilibacteroides sp.]MDD4114787.1 ATP synthase F1 subunit gamma [Massilibacteroides sp.]MDD4661192.1 ATP synthase F1 subunit gamma [Massilibacteroides sp.]
MISLKEVKRRILTIEGTQKITVARQMISSALLHKSQDKLAHIKTYKKAVDELYAKVTPEENCHCYYKNIGKGKTGIILIASNSGMCGSYNLNIVKEAALLKERYPNEELVFYPIGKKIREVLLNAGKPIGSIENIDMDELIEKPEFNKSAVVVRFFTELFLSCQLKQIIVVHTHFKSVGSQEVVHTTLLPYQVDSTPPKTNFIIEPCAEKIRKKLLERSLKAAFHTIIIDSLTAEYAARTIAMQLASENANEMISELQIIYNKIRQQTITSELLDIVGNSFA